MAGSEPTQASTGFRPTHRAPGSGLPTWPQPDAADEALPDEQSLAAGLVVEVLDQRADGWAQIQCQDGWTAWVDGRRLESTAVSNATSQEVKSDWQPTHVVVPEGAQAWGEPDPAAATAGALDPGLEVRVTEQQADGWVRILCANGWSAWVDGRRLSRVGGPPAVASPAPAPQLGIRLRAAGPLAVIGAALVVLGSFLPWWSSPVSVSAWDLPLRRLVSNTASTAQPRTGPLLLIVALVALPLVTGRSLPSWMLLVVAAVATNLALFALLRAVQPQPQPDPGLGAGVAFVGGVLILVEFWRRSWPSVRARWQ